jgi:restriction endonuclease S subunit
MTNEEIKQEKERCFKQIKTAQERLEEIRKICKHEKTYEGNYSFGCVQLADICEYCGELIRYK